MFLAEFKLGLKVTTVYDLETKQEILMCGIMMRGLQGPVRIGSADASHQFMGFPQTPILNIFMFHLFSIPAW